MQAVPKYRYRLTFSKEFPVKYVAHLDMVKAWTRAFRRAGLPLAYSEGFNPQARIQVAASLPVGTMGAAELMDIYLTELLDAGDILRRVQHTLPWGFRLLAVQPVPADTPSLQASLVQADYTVTVETDLPRPELTTRIEALLHAERLMQTRIRRGREERFDLRPLLHTLSVQERTDGHAVLTMRLAAGSRGNLRPDAVLEALGLGRAWKQIERTKLHFAFDR